MALYTIGEVALLCDINPVTLRAWQRRYGLLKPQRTDGGHRLFNDADIDRIREIKRWINNGVQVSKVKMLLSNENIDVHNGWREQQETLLSYLQSNNLHSLQDVDQRARSGLSRTNAQHPFVHSVYAAACNVSSRSCRRYWGSSTVSSSTTSRFVWPLRARNRGKMPWLSAGTFMIPPAYGWRVG